MHQGSTITGHGTAFGVDLADIGLAGRRYLLSAAHNVLDDSGNPFTTLKIEVQEGYKTYWMPCKVVQFDKALDLCLVEAMEDLPALCRIANDDARVGAPVIMTASPRGVPIARFDGTIAQRFYEGTARTLVRIKFDHGCSGGPLFSNNGEAIGVAVAGIPKDGDLDHNCGLFVPVSGIESFLSTVSPKTRVAPARPAVVAASTVVAQPKSEPLPSPTASVVVAPAAPIPAPEPKAPVAEVVPVPAVAAKVESAKPAVAAAYSPPPAATVAAPPVKERKPAALPKLDDDAKAEVVSLEDRPAVYHVVESGDNLSRLSKRYAVTMHDLVDWNRIEHADRIRVGMKLRVR